MLISEDKFRDDQTTLKVPSSKSTEIEHKKQIKKKTSKTKDVSSHQNLPSPQGMLFLGKLKLEYDFFFVRYFRRLRMRYILCDIVKFKHA